MSKKIIIYYILYGITILFLQNNCISIDSPIERPYDPRKAGAEIIESYDFSNIYKSTQFDKYMHISESNGKFYIIHNEKIYIYNKTNMLKINEINFNVRTFYPEFNSYYKDYYYNTDIAVNKDKILFSYTLTIKNLNLINKKALFDMDLSGDNFRELEASTDLQIYDYIGLNVGNDLLYDYTWIKQGGNISYISYDETIDKYNKIENWGMITAFPEGMYVFDIYGDTIWFAHNPRVVEGAYIGKRNINKPEELLLEIDVSYLGTNNRIEDILYDGKYIWIIIEKDGKMQLLKLGMDLIK